MSCVWPSAWVSSQYLDSRVFIFYYVQKSIFYSLIAKQNIISQKIYKTYGILMMSRVLPNQQAVPDILA